ncbi:hypothetical protein [Poriferisphaera sp. WC338]|uniref:hypothetical protein n=1 Tax=Poriferisphaera sp. WC338 TaxID=3425129 RepID=UPI003D8183AB
MTTSHDYCALVPQEHLKLPLVTCPSQIFRHNLPVVLGLGLELKEGLYAPNEIEAEFGYHTNWVKWAVPHVLFILGNEVGLRDFLMDCAAEWSRFGVTVTVGFDAFEEKPMVGVIWESDGVMKSDDYYFGLCADEAYEEVDSLWLPSFQSFCQ